MFFPERHLAKIFGNMILYLCFYIKTLIFESFKILGCTNERTKVRLSFSFDMSDDVIGHPSVCTPEHSVDQMQKDESAFQDCERPTSSNDSMICNDPSSQNVISFSDHQEILSDIIKNESHAGGLHGLLCFCYIKMLS